MFVPHCKYYITILLFHFFYVPSVTIKKEDVANQYEV